MTEPPGAARRPTEMSRNRWIAVVAAVAVAGVLGVLIGRFMPWNIDRAAGPPSPAVRQTFGFDAAYPDANPKVFIIRYGDSGSCPSEAVRHTVLQKADRVVVTLTRTPLPADKPCTEDYQAKLVRISLTAPLGTRSVIDGSRSTPVPISTGSPPFG